MLAGKFDLTDMLGQLQQIKKMGDVKGLLGMLPGVAKMKKQIAAANIDDGVIKRQEAIILSMTSKERHHPELIKASRKKRIAAGSGTSVQDVNKLLKQFEQMAQMMKQMKKLGKKGGMPPGFGGGMPPGLGGGGLPPGMGGGLPPGFPGGFKLK